MSEGLAWAAGFFDGEGSFHLRDASGLSPMASVSQRHLEVLLKFQEEVGFGKIYHRTKAGKDVWHWRVTTRREVMLLLELLRPWLGTVKVAQGERVLANKLSPRQEKNRLARLQ